jgi:hypothetical protein
MLFGGRTASQTGIAELVEVREVADGSSRIPFRRDPAQTPADPQVIQGNEDTCISSSASWIRASARKISLV